MTKEPIMIDDVDVAGCRHFNNNDKGYNQETEEFVKGACECITAHDSYGEFMYYGICKGRDCYYKQLKRKEQECERLKIEVKQIGTAFIDKGDLLNNALDKINQLKVENEAYRTSIIANLDGKISKRYRELLDENDLLKQALQEIKEIAEDAKTKVFVDMEEFWEQILQKCEVLKD